MEIVKINIPKPILKWVGGKSQIVDKLIVQFPTEMNNYHELFLGGGSVLFTLLTYMKYNKITVHGNVYAYDLNEPLIYLYKNIQTKHEEFYGILQNIIKDYHESGNDDAGVINRNPKTLQEAKIAKENYYYWIRGLYNKLNKEEKNSPFGSALFLFMNKTCFRGVFRMGPNGFNVPYGNYSNPEIINKEHLDEIHHLIQNVIFQHCDFETSFSFIGENDFTYIDPPYAPETKTSFVGYTENGFTINKHIRLFELIHELNSTNRKMMMNNADVSFVRENFENESYQIESIICKRFIHSKNPESKTKEVIIKNY